MSDGATGARATWAAPAGAAAAGERRAESRLLAVRRLLRSRGIWAGSAILAGVLVIAVGAPWLTGYDPMRLDVANRLLAPSAEHLFGTDEFGRDVYSLTLYGSRISLMVGGSVMALTSLMGIVIGLVAGYFRALENLLMRIADGLMAFPAIVLAIAFMAALGPRVSNIIIALTIVYMPRTARITYGAVLVARELPYVEAARATGARDVRVAFLHILPNCVAPLLVQGTFIFAYAVLAEATLSFLGVGAPPYIPSWGNVINAGGKLIQEAPWIALFPAIAITITGLGLNLLGDALHDALDPRLRALGRPR
jgi:peptide/nickel transport system permease protein